MQPHRAVRLGPIVLFLAVSIGCAFWFIVLRDGPQRSEIDSAAPHSTPAASYAAQHPSERAHSTPTPQRTPTAPVTLALHSTEPLRAFTVDAIPVLGARLLADERWTQRFDGDAARTADGAARVDVSPSRLPAWIIVRGDNGWLGAGLATTDGALTIDMRAGERVAGRVETTVGDGIDRARVLIEAAEPDSALAALLAIEGVSAETRADGSFEGRGLLPGRAHVIARAAGFAEDRADVELPATSAVTLVLRPGATLSGLVIDAATKAPIAGASITVSLRAAATVSLDALAHATTADDGSFGPLAVPVRPHRTTVVAKADGFAPCTAIVDPAAPGEGIQLTLELPRPASATGTTKDENGNPLADVRIELFDKRTLGPLGTWFSDADGDLVVDGLDASRNLTAQLSKPGFESVGYTWNDPTHFPAEFVVPTAGVVRGRVTNDRGEPVAARLVLIEDNPIIGRGASLEAHSDATTGAYVFSGVRRYRHLLDVFAPGYAPARVFPLLTVPGEQTHDVVLEAGARIDGTVTDAATAAPIAGAAVRLADVDSGGSFVKALETSTTTNADGWFVLEPVPTTRPIQLVVSAPSYASAVVDAAPQDGAASVAVALEPAASLDVRIRDTGGRFVRAFDLTLAASAGGWSTQRAASGERVLFDDLRPGTYDLAVRIPERIAGMTRQFTFDVVSLAAGESRAIVIDLGAGATVRGQLHGAGVQRFFESIEVVSLDANRTPVRTCRIADDGTFALVAHPAGTFQFLVTSTNACVQSGRSVTVDVPATGEFVLDLDAPTCGLFAWAIDASDEVRMDASVELAFVERSPNAPSHAKYARTQTATAAVDDGAMSFFATLPGRYLALARAPGCGFATFAFEIVDDTTWIEHEFVLGPEGFVRARVLDVEGALVQNASTRLFLPDDPTGHLPRKADARALPTTHAFDGLAPGTYRLGARAQGFFETSISCDVRANETTSIDLVMRRLCDLRITVLGANDAPLSGIALTVIDQTTGTDVSTWIGSMGVKATPASMTTGEDGTLTLTGLPEGSMRIVLGDAFTQTVVRAGQPNALVVRAP
ncbi:MAG: carboxypeptidase regulatory-like domain-containing protein [Planctomycetes bacterium]|nr:carboxypeptidase regulatory-like domain-containing protein [Planctomycetota bacterium]